MRRLWQSVQPMTCCLSLLSIGLPCKYCDWTNWGHPMYTLISNTNNTFHCRGVFSFFGVLVIFSSIYEHRTRTSERSGVELFKAFSLFVNFKLLCKMSDNKRSPNVIYCLNGIRSLSIIWIVFGHCYMVALLLPTHVNSADILDWLKTPFSMLLQSGTMSVDTFFFLSGFLLSWVAFKELDKSWVCASRRLSVILPCFLLSETESWTCLLCIFIGIFAWLLL